jgi:hypothetical protein
MHIDIIDNYFHTSGLTLFFPSQWTAPIPHALDTDSAQKGHVFAKRDGKEQTVARWTVMPFSVSQTVQVMAALTLRLRPVAVNPCGQEKTAQEVSCLCTPYLYADSSTSGHQIFWFTKTKFHAHTNVVL